MGTRQIPIIWIVDGSTSISVKADTPPSNVQVVSSPYLKAPHHASIARERVQVTRTGVVVVIGCQKVWTSQVLPGLIIKLITQSGIFVTVGMISCVCIIIQCAELHSLLLDMTYTLTIILAIEIRDLLLPQGRRELDQYQAHDTPGQRR